MSINLLIVTSRTSREKMERNDAALSLFRGLEEAGITWTLYYPREPLPGDITDYDAVLCWTYNGMRKNIRYWGGRFEEQIKDSGIPVINSVSGYSTMHSECLRKWGEAGIPCAKFEHFQEVEDITLPYPLILRADGHHQGRSMFLVHNEEEARKTIDEQFERYINSAKDDRRYRPLDIAIEYFDVKASDGFYHKRRVIAVGDELITREHTASTHWIVNIDNRVSSEISQKLNQQFFKEGVKDRELLLKAARTFGSDIVALDYTVRDDGSYIFWEANRHFKMHGNNIYGEGDINPATGRNYEEMQAVDRAVGRNVVKLIYKVTGKPVPA